MRSRGRACFRSDCERKGAGRSHSARAPRGGSAWHGRVGREGRRLSGRCTVAAGLSGGRACRGWSPCRRSEAREECSGRRPCRPWHVALACQAWRVRARLRGSAHRPRGATALRRIFPRVPTAACYTARDGSAPSGTGLFVPLHVELWPGACCRWPRARRTDAQVVTAVVPESDAFLVGCSHIAGGRGMLRLRRRFLTAFVLASACGSA
jgi:hypothetical protein